MIPLLILLTPKGEVIAAGGIGSGLWLNDNQRAEKLLEAGRAEEAVELFNNKKWQAAAHYRAGHFDESAKLLEGDQQITSQYNYGNAQAKLGKFPEAIKSYESVLEREPSHEDARYNLELLKKMVQQQQQNQPQSGDSSDQQQGDSDKQDGEGLSSSQDGESDGDENSQQDSGEGEQESRANQSAQQSDESQSESTAEQQQSGVERDSESEAQAEEREQAAQQQPDSAGEQQAQQQYQPQGDANEQWLRQIPDDPGGLLQRKFKYQYQQSYKDRERDVQPW